MENSQERGSNYGDIFRGLLPELLMRKQIQRAPCTESLATLLRRWRQPQPSPQGSKDKGTSQSHKDQPQMDEDQGSNTYDEGTVETNPIGHSFEK